MDKVEKVFDLYGVMAEFKSPEALLEAAQKTSQKGFKRIEAYSPFPIHGLAEALGMRDTRLPFIVLLGGILGGLGGFFLQYYASVISYPLNIGGRPLNSWPAFIPITFEMTILGAALSAVLGMLALNGLPMPYHPVFNAEIFQKASKDGFFLFIRAADPQFEEKKVREFLQSLNPIALEDVEP